LAETKSLTKVLDQYLAENETLKQFKLSFSALKPNLNFGRSLTAAKFVCMWHQTGKQKTVRLLPTAMLENDKIDCIKLDEYRGCSIICTGLVGTTVSLCIACKRTIYVCELNRTKQRHWRMKEITCPGFVQYMSIYSERLCVGYPSSFAIYSIQGEGATVGQLYHCKHSICSFSWVKFSFQV